MKTGNALALVVVQPVYTRGGVLAWVRVAIVNVGAAIGPRPPCLAVAAVAAKRLRVVDTHFAALARNRLSHTHVWELAGTISAELIHPEARAVVA